MCISIAVIIGAVIFLFRYLNQKDVNGDTLPTVATRDEVAPTQQPEATEEPGYVGATEAWGYTPAVYDFHEPSFDELMEINPDIYAWIYIPNTNVDYPILQTSGDDAFYLSHNYKKEYEFAGSIYTEKLNKKDFSDPNTLVYGHNMLNGSMFRTLHDFRDPDFFAANPYIYVYLPDRTLKYEIFAAYEYDDRHILYSFDFSDKDVYAEYLAYATNPTESMMYNRREVEVTTDDKIITLSTCLGNIDTSRYLVQGVLISDEPATDTDKGA